MMLMNHQVEDTGVVILMFIQLQNPINNQIHDVYNGLTPAEINNLISHELDFSTYSTFDQQLVSVLGSNSVLADLVKGIHANTEAKVNFDIVSGLPAGHLEIPLLIQILVKLQSKLINLGLVKLQVGIQIIKIPILMELIMQH